MCNSATLALGRARVELGSMSTETMRKHPHQLSTEAPRKRSLLSELADSLMPMERFEGKVTAHGQGSVYYIMPNSVYVQAVTRKLSSVLHDESSHLLRAEGHPLPAVGTEVDFSFDEADLLTAISVRHTQSTETDDLQLSDLVQRSRVEKQADIPEYTSSPAAQCPICADMMLSPATIACGHSGCIRCLTETLRVSGRCPICNTPHDSPLHVDIALRDSVRRVFRADVRGRGRGRGRGRAFAGVCACFSVCACVRVRSCAFMCAHV